MGKDLCFRMAIMKSISLFLFAGVCRAEPADLQALTQFRQQHRRTVDGRLCAAASVQDRHAFTGCTTARDPAGASGRPWCYVEAQLPQVGSNWNYCVAVTDYDALRASAAQAAEARAIAAQDLVGKVNKAQRAAEATLQLLKGK